MFDNFKLRRQNRTLRLLTSVARQKRIANIDDVRDIGIIFTVGDERDWNCLYAFTREMEKLGKQVHLLGFQADKQKIDYIFTHAHTTILHEKEDFSLMGIPKEGVCDGFTSRHYDLLLDATAGHPFFALYVAAKSLADLKVTYCHKQDNPMLERVFDLLIRGGKPFETHEFITHIKQYLSIIKK